MHPAKIDKFDLIFSAVIGELSFLLILFIIKALNIPYFHFLNTFSVLLLSVLFPFISLNAMYISQFLTGYIKEIIRISKFVLVGISNTLIDISAFIFMAGFVDESSLYILPIMKVLSFLIANINSFIWNKYWVFCSKNTGISKSSVELISFLAISVGGLIINALSFIVFEFILRNTLSISLLGSSTLSAIMASLFSFFWNFLGYKIFVFKTTS